MAYNAKGEWVAEDVQSPYTQRNVQQPGNSGWMVGNNGQTAGINSEGRMSDYDRMTLDSGVSSAKADEMLSRSQNRLGNNAVYPEDGEGLSRDPVKGSAMRINKGADPAIYGAGGLKGKQIYSTYDPDRPAGMGAAGNNPWQDMARQLASFSALRQNFPVEQGGVAVMADPADYWNNTLNSMRRDGYYDAPVGLTSPQMAGFIGQRDQVNERAQTQRRGQDMSFASQQGQQGVTVRGQDMQYRSHMAGIDAQGQNQRELAGIQGRNQLEVEGLRGRNQEQHDQRSYGQALDVEAMKQSNPYYASAAKENEAKSRLYGVQADQAEREANYSKTPHAQFMKEIDALGKIAQNTGDPAVMAMLQERLARLNAARRKSETAGYAEGGKVDPEELMRQMSAKYGAPTASQPAPQPIQQPRPVQQPQQPAPQGGLMDRMRAAATGNLEQRMRAAGAYAEGGPVGVGGRQVLGEGDGKSDSLPAVIDGEHPAALSTGEFVMPVEAVQHFGLAKLNKMVEQARKGLDTGR